MVRSAKENRIGRPLPSVTDVEFDRFRVLIEQLTGIHLKGNKRHLLLARLGGYIEKLGFASFSDYYDYLTREASGTEMRNLVNRITTNKTSFFREPHHFELLRSRLIPEIRQRGNRELRIWSAACSSGEEPYSIAIAVREALGPLNDWNVRVLASDIDTEMLAQAQAGRYPIESLEDVPVWQRRSHFLRGYGRYAGLAQVRPELRRMIDFRQINLNDVEWALPHRFDAIFCRNVIIYFDRALQERVVSGLASHLNPGGYLLLGHSETLHGFDSLVPAGVTAYQLPGSESPGSNTEKRRWA